MGAGVLTPLARAAADGALAVDGVPLPRLAEAVGTPAYVYSAAMIRAQYGRLAAALAGVPHRVHYSVKANSNLAVLALLRELGAGVDIVSGGELHRARLAGFRGADVVFSGVGKTAAEIDEALQAGVRFFNVESAEELVLVNALAGERRLRAPVALRVNPEVEVETPHHYTRTGGRGHKFGIPFDEALATAHAAAAMPHVALVGLDMHVGSQIARLDPYVEGIERLLTVLDALRADGIDTVRCLDLGGGLGVSYADEPPLELASYAALLRRTAARAGVELVVEPGRFLVADAGLLLTRVLYRKRSGGKTYVITDAGMTELMRPSHYQAYHRIEPVVATPSGGAAPDVVDVVGPVCESGDFLGLERELGDVRTGDLLVVHSAGAYGQVMASNYNSRARAPEVLVDAGRHAVVREREQYDDLVRLEHATPTWSD